MAPQLSRVGRFATACRRSGLAAGTQSVAFRAREQQGTFFVRRRSRIPCHSAMSRPLSAISCSIEFSRCPHGSRRRQGVWTTVTVHIGCTCSSVSSQRAFYFRPPILAYHLDIYPRVTLPSIPSCAMTVKFACGCSTSLRLASRTCGKSPTVRA